MGDDGQITIEVATKVAETLRNFDAVNKSVTALVGKIGQMDKQFIQTDQTERKMLEDGKRLWEQTRTAAEKAAHQQAEYSKLLLRGVIDQETFNRASAELGQTSEGMWNKLRAFGNTTVGQLVGITSAAGLAMKAVQLLGNELEAVDRRQQRAASQQIGEAAGLREMLRNLGGGDDVTEAQAVEAVAKISLKTGAPRATVIGALSSSFSARGTFPASQSVAATESALLLDPTLGVQGAASYSGSTLDFQKAFGGTTQQAQGMLLSGQMSSRVESADKYFKNMNPVLRAASSYGLSAQEAIAGSSAFTLSTADQKGEFSGTGYVQYIQEVTRAAIEADPSMRDKSFSEREQFLFTDPRGMQKRDKLVGVWARPLAEMKRRLKPGEEAGGEAKTLMTKIGMFTPGSKERLEYENLLRKTPTLEQAQGTYQYQVDLQKSIPGLQVAALDEQLGAGVEDVTNDPRQGKLGVVRKRVLEYVDQAGSVGNFSKELLDKKLLFNSMTETPEQVTQRGIDYLKQMREGNVGRDVPNFIKELQPRSAEASPEQLETNRKIERMIDILERQLRAMESQQQAQLNGPVPAVQQSGVP